MKWKQMTPRQQRKLLLWFCLFAISALIFLIHVICTLEKEKTNSVNEYHAVTRVSSEEAEHFNQLRQTAIPVTTGTYVETIKDISMKNSSYRMEFLVWFRWEGSSHITFLNNNIQIRNGTINKVEVEEDYHKDNLHYQKLRIDATIAKHFESACYPLGCQSLSFYIAPFTYTADEVVLVPDEEHSGVNENLSASGYSLLEETVGYNIKHNLNTMGNPGLEEPKEFSYYAAGMMLQRNSWGLFVQCFIALFGAVIWVLITLYICARHRVDPILTLPPALFGAVSNLVVDTNLLPDMVHFGLIEYMNLYGILIILAATLCIIQVNRIRSHSTEHAYADTFGHIMFYTMTVLSITGMILMPAAAYTWR